MKLIDIKAQVQIFYKIHDIIPEKLVLYHDFLYMLLHNIDTTYLGPEYLSKEDDINKHFLWCYTKTIEHFKKEHIFFKPNNESLDYLWLFFYNSYYLSDSKEVSLLLKEYFQVLFDYSFIKNEIDMQLLLEVYKIIDNSLIKNSNDNKQKNIII